MTEPDAGPEPAIPDDRLSLLALGSLLLRQRRLIVALGGLGVVLGLALGLLGRRQYVSAAIFIPESSSGGGLGSSELALAASQFGLRIPTASGGWGPAVYAELLRSREMLVPLATDTVEVAEEGGRRVPLMDLLKIKAATPGERIDRAVAALRRIVAASEDLKLGAVTVTVTTYWPSVSLALAQALVEEVNQFNVATKRSRAAAELQFVQAQADTAERALREAEDRLQGFLQRNVLVGSPQLRFEQDRLQREVTLRQQVYTTLVQAREEARIRRVRDTPVITLLESPRLPATGKPRRTLFKAMLGGLLVGSFGVLLAFIGHGVAAEARRAPSQESQEFFRLLKEATAFPRRGRGRMDRHEP